MHAEIIGIGTEILLGQIVDTNSAYLARGLADLGIEVYYHTIVGDNANRLTQALDLAATRSDLIVMSGGLGPTADDLTKQTVAKFLHTDLIADPLTMTKLDQYYQQSQIEPLPNNQQMAMYLDHSTKLLNDVGYAVGSFYQQTDGPDVLVLPGPPKEMSWMFDHYAIPALKAAYHRDEFLISRVLRFTEIGESELVTKIDDLIANQTNPTVAPYIKPNEVTLRLTAKAANEVIANQLLDALESQIQQRVGAYFYGYGDDNSLPNEVVQKLIKRDISITAAESLTAGLFQSTLATIPGVSAIFPGGFVTYANEAKEQLLAIPTNVIETNGVVSEATAIWMAEQARKQMNTDIAVSFTGAAGPDPLEGQPAGTVWIGLAVKDQPTIAQLFHLPGNRNTVRERSVLRAFNLIRQHIL
ncbi:competence damage-inducible protein A [Lentilactobacillus senioris DSM 24302 = JCM 17472]|uniref:Putative competence-damage inducible protein n=1 Tax=Lentilactobacillus senioris DSM 24302 = JCM 17472 TaxID=1423802 RepID=A0A0R2D380_9LACO|nr:competence/damage-inducible protein A [Lentilactobacillus senioris]KRM94195.1 competence damage-inducible protein A [Lentilactobacillus senioris DSM 24302 = JCM 17472]